MRTLDILRRLDRRTEKLGFVALSGLSGELDDEARALGAEIHLCRLNAAFPWRFRRLLRQGDWDVVHSHVQLSSGLILRYARQMGIPIRIAHFRSVSSGRPGHFARSLQERLMRHWLDLSATLILGNGESSIGYGWRADWTEDPRCAVIHNGIDTSTFSMPAETEAVRREFGWPADCQLGVHIGRMDPAKNHLRLIEIVGNLAQRLPSLRFLFVGRENGAISQSLRSRITSLGLEQRVALTGVRNDVPRLLKAADVMLFPSLWEGLPGAVLEARAAGTPVVASDLPSIREIAEHLGGVHCLPLTLSNEMWVRRISSVMSSVTEAQRSSARVQVEQSVYSIDRCVDAHRLAWSGEPGTTIRALYRQTNANELRRAS